MAYRAFRGASREASNSVPGNSGVPREVTVKGVGRCSPFSRVIENKSAARMWHPSGITRLSNSRIDGRIAPAISQQQQTLAQRQRLFHDMTLVDCQDCILVGRAGHLLLTVDCNSNRTSRIPIRGGEHVHYRIFIEYFAAAQYLIVLSRREYNEE